MIQLVLSCCILYYILVMVEYLVKDLSQEFKQETNDGDRREK